MLLYGSVELDDLLTFVEEQMTILANDTRYLRSMVILMDKVQWHYHTIKEATWETEAQMREKYSSLFEPSSMPLFYFCR